MYGCRALLESLSLIDRAVLRGWEVVFQLWKGYGRLNSSLAINQVEGAVVDWIVKYYALPTSRGIQVMDWCGQGKCLGG